MTAKYMQISQIFMIFMYNNYALSVLKIETISNDLAYLHLLFQKCVQLRLEQPWRSTPETNTKTAMDVLCWVVQPSHYFQLSHSQRYATNIFIVKSALFFLDRNTHGLKWKSFYIIWHVSFSLWIWEESTGISQISYNNKRTIEYIQFNTSHFE